ncbi:MAG: hypothetical protein ACXWKV_15525 [Caulobacteraceae bacterium]
MKSTLAPALGLALACLSGAAQARTMSVPADRVLSAARAASGGAGWKYLRGWHETGRLDGVAYETWIDPLRFGMRTETHEAAGVRVHGFNGQGDWEIAPGGQAVGTGDPVAVARARTAAFFTGELFLYPGRFEAKVAMLGVRQAGGQSYDVLKMEPWGGEAREVWFDRRTHLVARIVDRRGSRPTTIELSDYRKVGPVRVAFHYRIEGPDGVHERQVESLGFAPSDRDLFSVPRS